MRNAERLFAQYSEHLKQQAPATIPAATPIQKPTPTPTPTPKPDVIL